MSMFRAAQLNLVDEVVVALPSEEMDDNEVVLYQDMPSAEDVIEMHAPEGATEITFHLPFLPGADELVEVLDDDLAVETKGDTKEEKEKDKSKASDQPKDLNWAKQYIDNVPKHRGETLGLERAKSYLNRGLGQLSKIIQDDHKGKIDISKAEDARIVMEDGISRLEKELAKRTQKKKAAAEVGIDKKASTPINGIMITVPLKLSRIARVCINATISGGKSIEDIFKKQSEKWKLDDNEQADLIQLMEDMGFPMRRDRGFRVDDEEPYGYSSEKNFDYSPNYQA